MDNPLPEVLFLKCNCSAKLQRCRALLVHFSSVKVQVWCVSVCAQVFNTTRFVLSTAPWPDINHTTLKVLMYSF